MLDRRSFLRQMGLGSCALLGHTLERTARAGERIAGRAPFRALQVAGRVTARGRGLPGVAVTDGVTVAATDRDGGFAFASSNRQRYVSLSLPSGYAVPTHPQGTARCYRPLSGAAAGKEIHFALEPLPGGDREHAFLALADPQVLDAADVARLHAEAVPDIAATAARLRPRPTFAAALGDIMFDDLTLFPDYERAAERIGVPCFQVLGNHDVDTEARTDAHSTRTFERHFGPTYYSFNRGDVHYVVLDDVFWYGGYIGYVDQAQLDWLAADLALIEPGRTVVVFVHIPVYCESHVRHEREAPHESVVVTNRELLYERLRPYRAYIICGHMHESEYLHDGGAEIHVCGALCGAWWAGDICRDGTPNGYSIYTVNGSSLSWQYKATGHSLAHQMRLYPPGASEAHPRSLIANVWTADARWEVDWYENGERRGRMTRRTALDPLAVERQRGPDLPEKHGWVDPVPTDHLFFAEPGPAAREVTVEARDPWGRRYAETLRL